LKDEKVNIEDLKLDFYVLLSHSGKVFIHQPSSCSQRNVCSLTRRAVLLFVLSQLNYIIVQA